MSVMCGGREFQVAGPGSGVTDTSSPVCSVPLAVANADVGGRRAMLPVVHWWAQSVVPPR